MLFIFYLMVFIIWKMYMPSEGDGFTGTQADLFS